MRGWPLAASPRTYFHVLINLKWISAAGALWVRAPMEMRLTPVAATLGRRAADMEPEASRRARPAVMFHGLGHGGLVHIVQQDDVRTRGQGFLQAGQVGDLHFDLQEVMGLFPGLLGRPG